MNEIDRQTERRRETYERDRDRDREKSDRPINNKERWRNQKQTKECWSVKDKDEIVRNWND